MSSAFRPFSLTETLHVNEVLTQRLAEERARALAGVDAKPSATHCYGKYPRPSILDNFAEVDSAYFAEQKAVRTSSLWKAVFRKLFAPREVLVADRTVAGLSEENLRIIDRVTFSLNDLKVAAELARENLDSGN